MAELLVKAVDATHADPRKDAWCYKRGDVVVAFEDGHEWGKSEGPPTFAIVSVPGVPAEKFAHYTTEGLAQRRLLAVDVDMLPKRAVLESEVTAVTITKPVIPVPITPAPPVDDPPVKG